MILACLTSRSPAFRSSATRHDSGLCCGSASRDLCALPDVSARLRGTLVILYLNNDAWWTFSSMTQCRKIMRELEARGVPTTQDA
jgi:hypothetical protein